LFKTAHLSRTSQHRVVGAEGGADRTVGGRVGVSLPLRKSLVDLLAEAVVVTVGTSGVSVGAVLTSRVGGAVLASRVGGGVVLAGGVVSGAVLASCKSALVLYSVGHGLGVAHILGPANTA